MKNLNCIPFIVAVLFGFGVLTSSCSQSSSSTSGPDEEIASSDSSDTDTEKSAGSTGKKTNDGKKTSAESHEERTYKTLDRGPITWMREMPSTSRELAMATMMKNATSMAASICRMTRANRRRFALWGLTSLIAACGRTL